MESIPEPPPSSSRRFIGCGGVHPGRPCFCEEENALPSEIPARVDYTDVSAYQGPPFLHISVHRSTWLVFYWIIMVIQCGAIMNPCPLSEFMAIILSNPRFDATEIITMLGDAMSISFALGAVGGLVVARFGPRFTSTIGHAMSGVSWIMVAFVALYLRSLPPSLSSDVLNVKYGYASSCLHIAACILGFGLQLIIMSHLWVGMLFISSSAAALMILGSGVDLSSSYLQWLSNVARNVHPALVFVCYFSLLVFLAWLDRETLPSDIRCLEAIFVQEIFTPMASTIESPNDLIPSQVNHSSSLSHDSTSSFVTEIVPPASSTSDMISNTIHDDNENGDMMPLAASPFTATKLTFRPTGHSSDPRINDQRKNGKRTEQNNGSSQLLSSSTHIKEENHHNGRDHTKTMTSQRQGPANNESQTRAISRPLGTRHIESLILQQHHEQPLWDILTSPYTFGFSVFFILCLWRTKKYFAMNVCKIILHLAHAKYPDDPKVASDWSQATLSNFNLVSGLAALPALFMGALTDRVGVMTALVVVNICGTLMVLPMPIISFLERFPELISLCIATSCLCYMVCSGFLFGMVTAYNIKLFGFTHISTLQGIYISLAGLISFISDLWCQHMYVYSSRSILDVSMDSTTFFVVNLAGFAIPGILYAYGAYSVQCSPSRAGSILPMDKVPSGCSTSSQLVPFLSAVFVHPPEPSRSLNQLWINAENVVSTHGLLLSSPIKPIFQTPASEESSKDLDADTVYGNYCRSPVERAVEDFVQIVQDTSCVKSPRNWSPSRSHHSGSPFGRIRESKSPKETSMATAAPESQMKRAYSFLQNRVKSKVNRTRKGVGSLPSNTPREREDSKSEVAPVERWMERIVEGVQDLEFHSKSSAVSPPAPRTPRDELPFSLSHKPTLERII